MAKSSKLEICATDGCSRTLEVTSKCTVVDEMSIFRSHNWHIDQGNVYCPNCYKHIKDENSLKGKLIFTIVCGGYSCEAKMHGKNIRGLYAKANKAGWMTGGKKLYCPRCVQQKQIMDGFPPHITIEFPHGGKRVIINEAWRKSMTVDRLQPGGKGAEKFRQLAREVMIWTTKKWLK